MTDWIQISLDLLNQSSDRIVWNLFLAFIPLFLSYYLFRPLAIRNLVWWILLIIFMAFLPNAPYILTDSIHLIELSQKNYPFWAVCFVLIPQYTIFITLGFAAYVISLIKLDGYLIDFVGQKYIITVNATAHLLSVLGIYLGRFERFNSWDLIVKPQAVILTTGQDLLDLWKIFSMAIAFLVIWLLAELIKLINDTFTMSNRGNN